MLLYKKNRAPIAPTKAPTKLPGSITPLEAAAPVEADAGAVLVLLADPEALPERAAGVVLGVAPAAPELPALVETAALLEPASVAAPLAPAPNRLAPAVTETRAFPNSVASYVVVLDPGKFASLPPAVSLHTTDEVAKEQSIVAVKSLFGSDMSMLYVDGPYTIISLGKTPQSVEAGQAIATVVALASAATMDPKKDVASWPTRGTSMYAWSAALATARPRSVDEMNLESILRRFGLCSA